MQEIRDEFNRQSVVYTTKVNFNLACAVYAWNCITPELVQAFSKVIGAFPSQKRIAEKYKTYKDEKKEFVKAEIKRLNNATAALRLPSVREQRGDQEVFNTMMDIMGETKGVYSKIQDIQILFKGEETVNDILMEKIRMNTVYSARQTEKDLKCNALR